MRRRDLSTLFIGIPGAALAAPAPRPAIASAAGDGDLRNFGAAGDGITDDSAAWQRAVDSGFVSIPPGYRFRIVTPARRTGAVTIQGLGPSSRLLCDGLVLEVVDGTSSSLDNFWMENITAPWIITRDPTNWAADISRTLRQSDALGYQPTANDKDLWSSLTAQQQSQSLGPVIRFTGNAEHISVSRIYGRFVSLLLEDTRYSCVSHCNFRGGKGWSGGIYFDNYRNQPGIGNQASHNNIQYASFCGIAWNAQQHFTCVGNVTSRCGESGIKTQQRDGRLPTNVSYWGVISGNKSFENYYDGIDLMSVYPQAGDGSSDASLTYHAVTGNSSFDNGGTGMNADGRGNTYVGNTWARNGAFGFWGAGVSESLVANNIAIDNNRSRKPYHHEILVNGLAGGNSITGNRVHSSAGQNAHAIACNLGNTTARNYIAHNYATGSVFYFGNPRAQVGMLHDNVDDDTPAR